MARSFNIDEHPKKTLGKRTPPKDGFKAGMELQNLVNTLSRKRRGIIPSTERGIHSFSSFEEADEWMIKMIARAASL